MWWSKCEQWIHWKIILWRRSRGGGDRRVIELPSFAAFASMRVPQPGPNRADAGTSNNEFIYLCTANVKHWMPCTTFSINMKMYRRIKMEIENEAEHKKDKKDSQKSSRNFWKSVDVRAQRIPKRFRIINFMCFTRCTHFETRTDGRKNAAARLVPLSPSDRMLIFNEIHLFYIFRIPFAFFPLETKLKHGSGQRAPRVRRRRRRSEKWMSFRIYRFRCQ